MFEEWDGTLPATVPHLVSASDDDCGTLTTRVTGSMVGRVDDAHRVDSLLFEGPRDAHELVDLVLDVSSDAFAVVPQEVVELFAFRFTQTLFTA